MIFLTKNTLYENVEITKLEHETIFQLIFHQKNAAISERVFVLLLLQKCLSSNFELTTLNTVKSKEFVLPKYFKLHSKFKF